MSTVRKPAAKRAKSIQATPKRSQKSATAKLQAKTLLKAHRNGLAWEDSEVALVVKAIEKDETTYDLALALGRTYYSVMGTRRIVGFAMRHSAAIWGTSK